MLPRTGICFGRRVTTPSAAASAALVAAQSCLGMEERCSGFVAGRWNEELYPPSPPLEVSACRPAHAHDSSRWSRGGQGLVCRSTSAVLGLVAEATGEESADDEGEFVCWSGGC